MDPGRAQVFHRSYKIDLFDIEYDILITNEDIEFAAMTVDMMSKGLELDTSEVTGMISHAMKVTHPDVGFRLFGMLNIDLENRDTPETTIDLMGEVSKLSTKLSWFMLDILDIEIDAYNNNLHGYIVSKIFKDICEFIESILENNTEESDEESEDSDINDL